MRSFTRLDSLGRLSPRDLGSVTVTSVTLCWNLAGVSGVYRYQANRGLRSGLGWRAGLKFWRRLTAEKHL
jgi:hypothetical protein